MTSCTPPGSLKSITPSCCHPRRSASSGSDPAKGTALPISAPPATCTPSLPPAKSSRAMSLGVRSRLRPQCRRSPGGWRTARCVARRPGRSRPRRSPATERLTVGRCHLSRETRDHLVDRSRVDLVGCEPPQLGDLFNLWAEGPADHRSCEDEKDDLTAVAHGDESVSGDRQAGLLEGLAAGGLVGRFARLGDSPDHCPDLWPIGEAGEKDSTVAVGWQDKADDLGPTLLFLAHLDSMQWRQGVSPVVHTPTPLATKIPRLQAGRGRDRPGSDRDPSG